MPSASTGAGGILTQWGYLIYHVGMIYLENNTEAQQVLIPRTGLEGMGPLVLRLRSTVDLTVVLDEEVTDIGTSGLYYRTAVRLPEGCPDGSYEYELRSGGRTLSCGTVTVGKYRDGGITEYVKDEEYEQYENIGQ